MRSWEAWPVAELGLRVLLCRKFFLEQWEYEDLTAPYWRLYCNDTRGATVRFRWGEMEIEPGHVFLIPPETAFATRLRRPVRHFFVHFIIRPSFANPSGRAWSLEPESDLGRRLKEVLALGVGEGPDEWEVALKVSSLICSALLRLPREAFARADADLRVNKALALMMQSVGEGVDNGQLAASVGMHANAFSRLFRQEMGMAPQQFLRGVRIQEACLLLHHTDKTIDAIAEETGFCDRFHFSRVFRTLRGVGPATFRRRRTAG